MLAIRERRYDYAGLENIGNQAAGLGNSPARHNPGVGITPPSAQFEV
jgi:hypothetical protein